MAQQRLQKVMAEAGIASRRKCEEMICEGIVKVNGKVERKLPVMVDPSTDTIVVGRKKLSYEHKVYYLLNKPKKVVCTNMDPEGRRRAIDLMKDVPQRIYPVGRLDADSKGLLIMTNDGDLANQLTHPRFGVAKTYVVEIRKKISGDDIEKLKKGFYIQYRGRVTMDHIKVLQRGRGGSVLEIALHEGKNRQIRKMLAKLGHSVKNLTRVKIGPITTRGLGPGKHRELTQKEVDALREIIKRQKANADKTKPKPRRTAKKRFAGNSTDTKPKRTSKPVDKRKTKPRSSTNSQPTHKSPIKKRRRVIEL